MDQFIVGFSRPKSGFQPFSWLIRLVTWSPFSHAYIKFNSTSYDRWLIYQASGLKVNFIGETLFNEKEFIYEEYSIPVSDDAKKETIQFAIDRCGLPYSIKEILGIGYVLIMKCFGKRVKNPCYTSGAYVCSILISFMIEELRNNQDTFDFTSATPMDLRNFLISKGYNKLK